MANALSFKLNSVHLHGARSAETVIVHGPLDSLAMNLEVHGWLYSSHLVMLHWLKCVAFKWRVWVSPLQRRRSLQFT